VTSEATSGTSQEEAQVFECDKGRTTIRGFKIAEVRQNGVAVIIVACDARNCSALHLHLLMEEEDGELWVVTTLDSEGNEAVTRSGLLFRAISKLIYDNYDVKNVMPGVVKHEEKWEGTEIIPGLTKWGRG
jgi:hypothetical protein